MIIATPLHDTPIEGDYHEFVNAQKFGHFQHFFFTHIAFSNMKFEKDDLLP